MSEDAITHLCFDTETLAITPNAVVLSIAVVPFQFENPVSFRQLVKGGFYAKLSVEDQVRKYKRSIDPDTVAWWKAQGAEARAVLKPSDEDLTLEELVQEMGAFIKASGYSWKKSYVWSRGNTFDFGKIESMYGNLGLKEPYNTFMQRDIRTMIDCLTGSSNGKAKPQGERDGFVAHNCLHDAANDAATMTEIFQALSE
ncbi:exonuclease [Acidovorax phage ACP17]|uniref:Exonuclease A n=1 Tax=Acidovorax phage ACP17 TaxID=2010329 RepID=A0A218M305_9CAUD|nr:exonuclease [Acidovorax phage ACP17]ASD50425.1 exonuclease A [Acidovorax phage ACP17]